MSRPLQPRRDTRAEEDAQRRAVIARDGSVCRFEFRTVRGWRPCGKKEASDTAHIIRRPHLSPASRFHVDVALRACRTCHTLYDSYDPSVRVPLDRARRAWQTACLLSKVAPPARYNPDAERLYGAS